MYLKTPKRYRPDRRRRHWGLISRRTIFSLLAIVVLAGIGYMVWENQDQVRSSVIPEIEGLVKAAQTQVAPHPTPTVTPDLAAAASGCAAAKQRGDINDAIEQCTILADNNPNDVMLHYDLTHLLVTTSDFGTDEARMEQALEQARKTINANPEAPHGWAIQAMALDWAGEYGAALASALHAKALDETFAPSYAFLAEIYHDLGQDDVAMSYVDQALELDTSGIAIADALRNQGVIYNSQGNYEDSIRAYERAYAQTKRAYIAIELANNYVAMGQNDQAIALLSDALVDNPRDTGILWSLGWYHVRNGNKEEGYNYYRRCLDNDPENINCLSYLGGLQYIDGEYTSAINNLSKAIDLGSTDITDFYQIGSAHAAVGRCDLGIPYLQQGYQMATERQNPDQQSQFASLLSNCGAAISQPIPTADAAAATETAAPAQ